MKRKFVQLLLFGLLLFLVVGCTIPQPVVDFNFKAPERAKAFELEPNGGNISGIELASENVLMVISNAGKILVAKIQGVFEQDEGIFHSSADYTVVDTLTPEEFEALSVTKAPEREVGVFLGDFNLDGIIDLLDLGFLLPHYGSTDGDANYDANFDIAPATDGNGDGVLDTSTPDGIINAQDMEVFTWNYGKVPELEGPSFLFFSSQREGQYLAENVFGEVMSDSFPEGRYAYLSWLVDKPLEAMTIRFYKFDEGGNRRRMNMDMDTGEWEVLPVGAPSSQQIPLDWAVDYGGLYGEYFFLPNNYFTDFFLPDEILEIYQAFDLGVTYAMWIDAYDVYGNTNYLYLTFRLEERYTGEDYPEIYLTATLGEGTIEVSLKADNLEAYTDGTKKGTTSKDQTSSNGMMYFNIPVAFDPNLSLVDVAFPQFLDGKQELNAFFEKVTPVGEQVVEISKGFVDGNAGAVSEGNTLAVMTFEIPAGYEGLALFTIYKLNQLSDYPLHESGVVLRDNDNRPIDGIVTEPSYLGVPVL